MSADAPRVLFVSSGNSSFGISPFIEVQGEALMGLGVDVTFYRVVGRGPFGYLRNYFPLRRQIRRGRFDLVHAHYSFCGLLALLAVPRRLPVVLSFLGTDLYGTLGAEGQQTLAGRLHRIHARLLAPSMAAVIVKAPFMLQRLPKRVRPHARVIPNGVNLDVFKPMDRQECRQRLGLHPSAPVLLFLGDPADPRKGYGVASAALEIVRRTRPDAELLTPYPVPHNHVPSYLNAADVLLLCSSMEGSPNVVKEAMACNTPIVATEVGDVRDLLAGASQCHIAAREPGAFAPAVMQILDRGTRSDARSRMDHLSAWAVARRVADLYRDTLTSRA